MFDIFLVNKISLLSFKDLDKNSCTHFSSQNKMKYFSNFCRYFISYSFFVMTNSKLWGLKVQNLQAKTEKINIYVRLKTYLSFKIFVLNS